jgi:hypothetical protein
MAGRKLTHYQILRLDPGVDDDVLTAVYRRWMERARLADLTDGRRAEVLRAFEEAYVVLHDPERRRDYDEGLAGPSGRAVVPVAVELPALIPLASSSSSSRDVVPGRKSPVPAASTRVLDFGRYAGWSLREVALRDRDYLEWLRRSPGGPHYRADIAAILTPR